MDPYMYQRAVDDIARQVMEHRKNGTAPLCRVVTLVDADTGFTAQGVEYALTEQLGALGVYVTARAVGGFAAYQCEIEGPPAVLFGLVTDGFLNGGLHVRHIDTE